MLEAIPTWVEAGVEDTAEWAVVPRQMAQVQP